MPGRALLQATLCLLLVCVSEAAVTATNTYTYPGFDDTLLSQAIALSGNAGNTRLYKLIGNSTYGAILSFTRNTGTGALTPLTNRVTTMNTFSRPFLVGCTDIRLSSVALYVACSSVVMNGSFTEQSRVLILDPVTLGQLQSQRQFASAFGAAGGSMALVGSTVTSLLLGTSVVGFVNFPSVSLVDGTLPASTAVSGTPISQGVHGIEGAVIWWGNTNSVTPGWKCFARSSSGVVSSSGSSAFGSSANIAAVYGMFMNSGFNNIYSVELPTGEFRPRFRTYSLAFNVGGGTPAPPVVSSSSPVYNYYPDTDARTVYMPNDDRHIYVLSNSSLYEYRRSLSANNGGVPLEVNTVATSLVEPNGVVASSDGLFVYVASGAGVTALTRDATSATPSLTSPVASGRYGNIPLQYTLPEAPSSNVKLTLAGSSTFVLTMAQSTSVSTTIIYTDPASSASVVSVSGAGAIPNGAYTVTLTYQDVYNNEPASSSSFSITVDTVTQTPTLTSPAANSFVRSTAISVQYTLAEACASGTITFTQRSGLGTPVVWTLHSSGLTAGTKSATINAAAVSGIIASSTGGALDDVFDVTLSVVDLTGNPAATATKQIVTVRSFTRAPVWVLPVPSAYFSDSTTTLRFILPSPALAGSVQLSFAPRSGSATVLVTTLGTTNGTQTLSFDATAPLLTAAISSGSAIAAGEYNVTVSYQDDAGNTANSSMVHGIVVRLDALAITQTGVTSSSPYDNFVFNATLPLPSLLGRMSVIMTNNNFTRTVVAQMTDITALFFKFLRFNLSADLSLASQLVLVGGGFSSASPTGAFPNEYLAQTYSLQLSMRDYANRFTVTNTVATGIVPTTPFCTLSFRAPCSYPEYAACAARCATTPSLTSYPVTVTVVSETSTTVVVVQTVDRPIYVVREGVNSTFYNTSSTTNTVRIPVSTGWSDAEFFTVLGFMLVFAVLTLLFGSNLYCHSPTSRGYSRI